MHNNLLSTIYEAGLQIAVTEARTNLPGLTEQKETNFLGSGLT